MSHADFIGCTRCRIRLPQSEEQELWRRMRRGDQEAHEQLVRSQIPHVIMLARRFQRPGIDLDDLIQIGLLALLECLVTFDARRSRLSTYCRQPILWRLSRAILQDYSVVRRPATRTSKTEDHYWRAGRVETLDVEPQARGSVEDADEDLDTRQQVHQLRAVIETLPARERAVVEGRLAGRTLADIGDELGVSKERIRQIELKAKSRLRESLTRAI